MVFITDSHSSPTLATTFKRAEDSTQAALSTGQPTSSSSSSRRKRKNHESHQQFLTKQTFGQWHRVCALFSPLTNNHHSLEYDISSVAVLDVKKSSWTIQFSTFIRPWSTSQRRSNTNFFLKGNCFVWTLYGRLVGHRTRRQRLDPGHDRRFLTSNREIY